MLKYKSIRKDFSNIGLALFTIGIVTTVLQFFFSILWTVCTLRTPLANTEWAMWLVTFAPMYLIAVPIGLAIMRTVPADHHRPAKLGAKRFWMLMLMCMPVMYIGNIIGNVLSLVLSAGTAENALLNYIDGNPLLTVLFAVIIAPIAEEYIFRKQIIDRLSRYSEKTAVLVSALTFGLFHMNLFQFFYAFGLGILFAYVYVRTHSVRYPIFMHMLINFQGSVIAPWIMKQLDPEFMDSLLTGHLDVTLLGESLPGLLIYMTYSALLMLGVVGGLALLIINWKKRQLSPVSQEMSSKEITKAAFCNVGMILFSVFCVIMILFSLLAGLL